MYCQFTCQDIGCFTLENVDLPVIICTESMSIFRPKPHIFQIWLIKKVLFVYLQTSLVFIVSVLCLLVAIVCVCTVSTFPCRYNFYYVNGVLTICWLRQSHMWSYNTFCKLLWIGAIAACMSYLEGLHSSCVSFQFP